MFKKIMSLVLALMLVPALLPAVSLTASAEAPPAEPVEAAENPQPTTDAWLEEKAVEKSAEGIEELANEPAFEVRYLQPGEKPAHEKWISVNGWQFESNPTADGWYFVDVDGDSYNWEWVSELLTGGRPIASSGSYSIRSCSYINGVGGVTPNNWAISPNITIPAGVYSKLYFDMASYSGGYPETFSIAYCENWTGLSGEFNFRVIASNMQTPTSELSFQTVTMDLTPLAGKTVALAFIHHNCTDQYKMYIDDVFIETTDENPNPTPTPTPTPTNGPYTQPEGELVYSSGFESQEQLNGWNGGEADGDGKTWQFANSGTYAYEGSGFMGSYSRDTSGNLTPDNLLKSPLITVPANSSATLSFMMGGLHPAGAEHFAVYATTASGYFPTPDNMDLLISETVTDGVYRQYTADLSQYAGQSVYIVFRHFNTTGQLILRLDKMEVYALARPISLDEAMNATGGTLHFESTGAHPWTTVTQGERSYAKSGNAGVAGSTSTVTTTVQSDGYTRIGFEFKAWGEGTSIYYDKCEFIIDGTVVATWGAYQNSDWEFYNSEYLSAGTHTVEWKYTKDNSVNRPEDCFMVDNVMLGYGMPQPPAVPIDTVEITDLVIPAWGEHPSFTANVPADAPYSVDVVVWRARLAGVTLDSSSVFNDPNEVYGATVLLTADDGYEFLETVNITINGETSLVNNYYDYSGQLAVNSIGFTVSEPTVIWGDATGNGIVNIEDALMLMRHMMGIVNLSDEILPRCNVDGNDETNVADALMIMRRCMDIIDAFPVE